MVKTITINDEVYRDKSADIMGRLLKAGKPVNIMDVLISGIALANGIEEIIPKDSDFNRGAFMGIRE